MFLRERLAKNDLKVKIYAEKDKNLVTTTFNNQKGLRQKRQQQDHVKSCPEQERRR